MPTSFCRLRSRSKSSRASSSRPMSARLSTNQNVVSRNVPSPAGSPSTRVAVGGRVPQHEPVDHQLPLDGLDRADDPRVASGGGTRPGPASAGSSRADRRRSTARSCSSSRRSPSRRPRPSPGRRACATGRSGDRSRPIFSAIFAARSNATQAMTFDWVKCRCGPRISQMPSSGCCQTRSRCSIIAGSSSPRLRVMRGQRGGRRRARLRLR